MKSLILGRQAGVLLRLACIAALGAACGDPPPTAAPSDNTSVQITRTTDPNPARSGLVTLTLVIRDAAGRPRTDADSQVHIAGDMPSMRHGGIEGNATQMGNGTGQAKGRFSLSGEWRGDLKVRGEVGD